MRCPRCSTNNPEQAKFCMSCAAVLVVTCAECGTELPPTARFCYNCASPIGGAPEVVEEQVASAAAQALKRLAPREYAERLLATRGQVEAEWRS